MNKEELLALFTSIKKQFTPQELARELGIQELLSERSCLSDRAILKHKEKGNIIIEPFVEENLSTSSYDVTLGPYYYREKSSAGARGLFNPYDEHQVRRIWKPFEAKTARQEAEDRELGVTAYIRDVFGNNIDPQDRIIIIAPGETILAHTMEFIGGIKNITTMMKARSSLGRNFIEICKCAGWGDGGYCNRWTMEITNNSQHYHVPRVVGRRIAQLVFFEVEPILDKTYAQTGKYQTTSSLQDMQKNWTPDAMIPKMWKDREVVKR